MNNLRINVGCGNTPTNDWINYDNSLSIVISKLPMFIPKVLLFLGEAFSITGGIVSL